MFEVKIKFEVLIAGCPEKGLAAVEFRREHGLPEAPTNRFRLEYQAESDPDLCRAWPKLLNGDADMRLAAKTGYSDHDPENCSSPEAERLVAPLRSLRPNSYQGERYGRHELDCGILSKWMVDAKAALPAVLTALSVAADADDASFRAKDRAEAEEQSKLPLNDQVKNDYTNGVIRLQVISPLRYYADLAAPAVAEIAAIEERRKAEAEKAEQDRLEAERRAAADREKWIREHGSDRLKRCVEEGIDCEAVYRDERLAKERPGWRWEARVEGQARDPRNPSADAFTILDEARKTDPDCELKWWTIDHEHTEECSDYDECPKFGYSGYVALGVFLGREIVFGRPE